MRFYSKPNTTNGFVRVWFFLWQIINLRACDFYICIQYKIPNHFIDDEGKRCLIWKHIYVYIKKTSIRSLYIYPSELQIPSRNFGYNYSLFNSLDKRVLTSKCTNQKRAIKAYLHWHVFWNHLAIISSLSVTCIKQ